MPESDESLGGYPKVAAFMGLKPGFNIFRRFGALNARNLLYMQAELNELELELQEIAIEDATCEDPKRLLYATRWRDLNEGRDDVQWKMVLRIRERLKEYSTCPRLS